MMAEDEFEWQKSMVGERVRESGAKPVSGDQKIP